MYMYVYVCIYIYIYMCRSSSDAGRVPGAAAFTYATGQIVLEIHKKKKKKTISSNRKYTTTNNNDSNILNNNNNNNNENNNSAHDEGTPSGDPSEETPVVSAKTARGSSLQICVVSYLWLRCYYCCCCCVVCYCIGQCCSCFLSEGALQTCTGSASRARKSWNSEPCPRLARFRKNLPDPWASRSLVSLKAWKSAGASYQEGGERRSEGGRWGGMEWEEGRGGRRREEEEESEEKRGELKSPRRLRRQLARVVHVKLRGEVRLTPSASQPGCLAARLPGCLAIWLTGRLTALTAWLPGCLGCLGWPAAQVGELTRHLVWRPSSPCSSPGPSYTVLARPSFQTTRHPDVPFCANTWPKPRDSRTHRVPHPVRGRRMSRAPRWKALYNTRSTHRTPRTAAQAPLASWVALLV